MSFTLGASFGYPEANAAREVLMDEKLVPFHVAVDIGYGEQAALADMILPEATSLERWDYHSTNNYGLIPYTGLRQPLVKPQGETKSIQTILHELAHKIGGGMEKHFTYKDEESLYKDWYKNLPISWEDFKRRGIWQDTTREKDYQLYERPLSATELEGATVPKKDGELVLGGSGKTKGKPIGIIKDGKPVRGFPTPNRVINVFDPIFPEAAKAVGLPLTDGNASPVPVYHSVPEHVDLPEDRFIFSTFKWNVHTQGRSGHWKYAAEIIHTNPVFMHPETGKQLGVKEGDSVEISVFRPTGHTYRAGEKGVMGSFKNHVRFLKGMHRRVVMCSHHVGHFEHGIVGKADTKGSSPAAGQSAALADKDLKDGVWWSKKKGGIGGGVHINDALPINPAPLIGGQNWYDNVCKIEKV